MYMKNDHIRIFLLGPHSSISYKTRKTDTDFLSFIRSCSVLPQQKCSVTALLPGWGLELFERPSYRCMGYTFFSSLKISNKNILKNILEI